MRQRLSQGEFNAFLRLRTRLLTTSLSTEDHVFIGSVDIAAAMTTNFHN